MRSVNLTAKVAVRKGDFKHYSREYMKLLKELQLTKNAVDAKEQEILKLLEEYHAAKVSTTLR